MRALTGVLVTVAATRVLAQAPAAAPTAPAAWKATGTIDFGFVSSTGNTDVTSTSFGDKISATKDGWTLSQFLADVYAKTNGVESANQLRIGIRAERTIVDHIGGFAAAVYERNAFAGYNSRVDELLGVQWKPIADSTDDATIDLGGVYTEQTNTDGTHKSSPSARAALVYKHTFKKATYFSQSIEYVPNLQQQGEYRLNTETALVAPLSARIGIKLGYVFQFNSKPPVNFGTTDRVITSGLQISF